MAATSGRSSGRSITYTPVSRRLDPLKLSVSCVPGNLAVQLDSRKECCGYAIAHRSEIVIINWSSETNKCRQSVIEPFPRASDLDSLTFITGMKWCELSNKETVFVATSYSGFVVFNNDCSSRLFHYRLPHKDTSHVTSCARGITSTGNALCIGTSDGYILVFSITSNEGVEFHHQLGSDNDPPISCLASDEDGRVASGNENGEVIVWRDPTESRTQEKIAQFNSEMPVSCTQIKWWRDFIVISYSNGKLTICSPDRGIKLIDIGAHGRLISGLDIAIKTGLILTTSEDSTFCVWKLSGSSRQPKMSLVYSGVAENSLLTGGSFCDPHGTVFAITSYDSNTITEYGQEFTLS